MRASGRMRMRQDTLLPSGSLALPPLSIGGSRNWEDGRSTGKVFSGLRRMSEDSGAGTQPGSCGPQEGIPGASLDSSGSGRGPGSLMSSRPVARRRNRYSGSSSGAGDGEGHGYMGAYAAVAALVRARCMAQSKESQESTEMDMVPGPEVVRTLSFVGEEALGGAARVGNPTVGQGAISDVDGLDIDGVVALSHAPRAQHALFFLLSFFFCCAFSGGSGSGAFSGSPPVVPNACTSSWCSWTSSSSTTCTRTSRTTQMIDTATAPGVGRGGAAHGGREQPA
eukprot:scaffold8075_cov115-Isochrysis_galbana.AAC.11